MLRPLGDRVLVKRTENEKQTQSGIYIPDTALDKSMEGVVVAVGPGSYDKKGNRKPPAINEGDRIVFGKWSGDDVTVDNEDFVMITEANIIGVLRERN